MSAVLMIVSTVAAILLIIIVLLQNSKGGGLDSSFGNVNQLGGVAQSTETIEKATWTLAITLIVLSLASNFAIPRQNAEEPAEIKAQEQIDDAVIPNLPSPPVTE